MAPTVASIHLLVWKNLKILRAAAKTLQNAAKDLQTVAVVKPTLQPAYARVARQPIHPAAFLKQSRRWLSTRARILDVARNFGTSARQASVKVSRVNYASSRIGLAISQSTGRAPFASCLRPNLTAGAFSRSAGGYGLGSGRIGGQRYFSHGPAAPAQVIQNVSQGMRAFMMGGKKLQYDGSDSRTGEMRFKTVSTMQDKATKRMNTVPRATPGSFLNFNINPTITALAPTTMSGVAGFAPTSTATMSSLNSEGLLDVLSVDFTRSLRELALIMADLRNISSLGDLPISYENNRLRVHFPGVDPETVESIVAELGIKRGVVGQDPDFDDYVGTEIALLFPFAPSESSSAPSLYGLTLYDQGEELMEDSFSSPTTLSDTGLAYDDLDELSNSDEGFETLPSRSLAFNSPPRPSSRARDEQSPFEYQDFEGIYRFIELCDTARR